MYVNIGARISFSPFLCDLWSQRYIFGAKNTTRISQGLAKFIFFRKICKKNTEKLARNINCLYICNDFKNEIRKKLKIWQQEQN